MQCCYLLLAIQQVPGLYISDQNAFGTKRMELVNAPLKIDTTARDALCARQDFQSYRLRLLPVTKASVRC